MWAALIWPVVANILLLSVPQFRRRTIWWEYLLPWVPAFFLIPIGTAVGEWAQTTDIERWGGHAVKACYYEDWNERVPCRHKEYERQRTGTDSNGNAIYTDVFVGYAHRYDVDYHPEEWTLETTLGEWSILQREYRYFVSLWGGEQFVELNRDYHTNDGDMYLTRWGGRVENLEPVFVDKRYENRPQATPSLFGSIEVDPTTTPVYEYPDLDRWRGRGIIGPHRTTKLDRQLCKLNAIIGPRKECQVWILTWKNQPQSVAHDQRAYWKGGNKNEMVICLSTDDQNRVQWSYVFSWMDNQEFSYRTRDYILEQRQLDLASLIDWLGKEVPKRWTRKQFSANAPDGGFAYLTVKPPTWLVVLLHVLTIGASCGVVFFVVNNEFESSGRGMPPHEVWRELRQSVHRTYQRFCQSTRQFYKRLLRKIAKMFGR